MMTARLRPGEGDSSPSRHNANATPSSFSSSEGLFFSVGDCIAECLANTRVVEGSCIECGEGIATCDSEGTPLTCGTGPDGAQRFLTPSGTCASECPPRSFADLSTLACQDCPSGALTCASAEEALTCGPFDEAVTFLSADGKCVRNCALGTYPDEGEPLYL